jgi:hypothetical protein
MSYVGALGLLVAILSAAWWYWDTTPPSHIAIARFSCPENTAIGEAVQQEILTTLRDTLPHLRVKEIAVTLGHKDFGFAKRVKSRLHTHLLLYGQVRDPHEKRQSGLVLSTETSRVVITLNPKSLSSPPTESLHGMPSTNSRPPSIQIRCSSIDTSLPIPNFQPCYRVDRSLSRGREPQSAWYRRQPKDGRVGGG